MTSHSGRAVTANAIKPTSKHPNNTTTRNLSSLQEVAEEKTADFFNGASEGIVAKIDSLEKVHC
jgi:hypothetical protein